MKEQHLSYNSLSIKRREKIIIIKMQTIFDQSINLLLKKQLPNGSFPSFTTSDPLNFKKAYICESIFASALALISLNKLPETKELKIIKKKLASFLLSQKSPDWSFNYWARESKDFKRMPYPDDLDDTSCALAALYGYDKKLIDGEAMAKFVLVLTALEQKEGGPYKSWLVGPDVPKTWHDVDLAVNANIAFFLATQEVSLNNINKLIEDAIDTQTYYSPYYPTAYSIIYFISRSYTGKKIPQIIDFLLAKREADYKWNNPQDTALVISSLLNFKKPIDNLEASIDYLLKTQKKDWKAYPFYTGIKPSNDPNDKTMHYAGCAALTTALCLEALNKYNQTKIKKSINKTTQKQTKTIQQQVKKQAEQNFYSLSNDIQKLSKPRLAKAIKTDKEQPIILLPYLFLSMLSNNERQRISDDILIKLGLANLYGWIAYAIYDDFIDNEGNAKLLPLANICLRELIIIFNDILPKKSKFHIIFKQIMDEIESANTWEVNHCRVEIKNNKISLQNFDKTIYKNLDKLAERSMGHALCSIAILFNLGYTKDSSEIKNLILFFRHYIIARQLNDDAHDWEEDLQTGRITPVVEAIFKKFKSQSKKTVDTKKDLEQLQSIFWHKIIPDICPQVLENTKIARIALNNITIIQNNAPFEKFLSKVEKAAHDALDEQEKTLKFLGTYEKNINIKN